MTADEWLRANNKAPYQTELYHNWYWGTYLYYHGKVFSEEEIDPEDKVFTLPITIWEHLQAPTTYPYVKSYKTREEALDDFRQAYDKAVLDGWLDSP